MASSGSEDLRDVSILGRSSKKTLEAAITANIFVLFILVQLDGSHDRVIESLQLGICQGLISGQYI